MDEITKKQIELIDLRINIKILIEKLSYKKNNNFKGLTIYEDESLNILKQVREIINDE